MKTNQTDKATAIESLIKLAGINLQQNPTNQAEALLDGLRRLETEHAALVDYKEACEKFVEFLNSLPRGWLGKTSGDVGLLNDAYLQESKAKRNLAAVREGKAVQS